jgi:hypothetical protein
MRKPTTDCCPKSVYTFRTRRGVLGGRARVHSQKSSEIRERGRKSPQAAVSSQLRIPSLTPRQSPNLTALNPFSPLVLPTRQVGLREPAGDIPGDISQIARPAGNRQFAWSCGRKAALPEEALEPAWPTTGRPRPLPASGGSVKVSRTISGAMVLDHTDELLDRLPLGAGNPLAALA